MAVTENALAFEPTETSVDTKSHSGTRSREVKVETSGLDVFYGETQAIKSADLAIHAREVLALIGPSGCGKSTFLRCLNRMNDPIRICRIQGQVLVDGEDIYSDGVDPVQVRARIGMVFQKPNPFPKSIYDNIAFGLKVNGFGSSRKKLDDLVEQSLQRAGLWDEVKDRLGESGTSLSGGQQQRLCIARAIALNPEVILMDEPCSSLDPNSTARVEELIEELREKYTIIIVTHNTQQAMRVSQRTAYFHLGEVVEVGKTNDIFDNPREKKTQDYMAGRFG